MPIVRSQAPTTVPVDGSSPIQASSTYRIRNSRRTNNEAKNPHVFCQELETYVRFNLITRRKKLSNCVLYCLFIFCRTSVALSLLPQLRRNVPKGNSLYFVPRFLIFRRTNPLHHVVGLQAETANEFQFYSFKKPNAFPPFNIGRITRYHVQLMYLKLQRIHEYYYELQL